MKKRGISFRVRIAIGALIYVCGFLAIIDMLPKL